MDGHTPADQVNGMVKSAERSMEILELLTGSDRGMTHAEILAVLGYPRASLHGLLHTLTARGWLERSVDQRHYHLGVRCWEAGNTYQRAATLVQRATPFLEHLRDQLDETVQLGVLDGIEVVYIAKESGSKLLTLASDIGRRLDAHATGLGKVLLADLAPEEVDRRYRRHHLTRFTSRTLTTIDALNTELEAVRRRGYARDREEYTIGVTCVAMPLRDGSSKCIAALSVSVPTVRGSVLREAYPLLDEQCRALSASLGYQPPPPRRTRKRAVVALAGSEAGS